MKYSIILILNLSLVFSTLYGQDLQNLDRKFGIKKFKLETDLSLYKSQLKLFVKDDNGLAYYNYVGNDINEIFNVPVDDISLVFYKNSLFSISIIFKETNEQGRKIIHSKLTDLFGKSVTGTELINSSYDWAYIWKTKKTFLQHSKRNSTTSHKPNKLEIFIISQKLERQIANDSF